MAQDKRLPKRKPRDLSPLYVTYDIMTGGFFGGAIGYAVSPPDGKTTTLGIFFGMALGLVKTGLQYFNTLRQERYNKTPCEIREISHDDSNYRVVVAKDCTPTIFVEDQGRYKRIDVAYAELFHSAQSEKAKDLERIAQAHDNTVRKVGLRATEQRFAEQGAISTQTD